MLVDPELRLMPMRQGSDFEEPSVWVDLAGDPLTGEDWTPRCTIRTVFGGPVIATFGDTGQGDAGTAAFVGEDADTILLSMPGDTISGLPATQGTDGGAQGHYLADLVVTHDTTGERHSLRRYIVTISREATTA